MRSLLLMGLLGLGAASAFAQALVAPAAPAGKVMLAQAATQSNPASSSQSSWKQLSPSEQIALRPLAANWDNMGIGQKRKWQSVAKDFDKLPAEQQTKMHARMTEWIALSPKQRADARINFAENRQLTDGLTPEQRKVQWQAYQQLSPEEKRKLAESAPKASIAGAAPAARPQPVLKKEPAPVFGTGKVLANAKAAPHSPAPGKKIAVERHVAAQGSVLPGHASSGAEKQ